MQIILLDLTIILQNIKDRLHCGLQQQHSSAVEQQTGGGEIITNNTPLIKSVTCHHLISCLPSEVKWLVQCQYRDGEADRGAALGVQLESPGEEWALIASIGPIYNISNTKLLLVQNVKY